MVASTHTSTLSPSVALIILLTTLMPGTAEKGVVFEIYMNYYLPSSSSTVTVRGLLTGSLSGSGLTRLALKVALSSFSNATLSSVILTVHTITVSDDGVLSTVSKPLTFWPHSNANSDSTMLLKGP